MNMVKSFFSNVLSVFDYIFYRFYVWNTRQEWYDRGLSVADIMLVILFTPPILLVLLQFESITQYGKTVPLVVLFVIYFIVNCRYGESNEKISQDNYAIFRRKWGNENPIIHRRRKLEIIALLLFNFIILPLAWFIRVHYFD